MGLELVLYICSAPCIKSTPVEKSKYCQEEKVTEIFFTITIVFLYLYHLKNNACFTPFFFQKSRALDE